MLKGRIIKGVGGIYYVDTSEGVFDCSIRGIFRKGSITPTVGDYVDIKRLESEKLEGVIEKIYDRKNILIRPKVCNIDCAIITFAITKPSINIDLLNKFLILAELQKIKNIIICINKCDLDCENELQKIKNIYQDMYQIVFLSTKNKFGKDKLITMLKDNVSVFAGPSGVGKTSIINMIIPNTNLKIGEISEKIERGKHTTRQVELIKGDGLYIVDSPGFSSLSIDFIDDEELGHYFKDFRGFIDQCKFTNCRHLHEPNCAIKEQIGGRIHTERYEYYKKILNDRAERK